MRKMGYYQMQNSLSLGGGTGTASSYNLLPASGGNSWRKCRSPETDPLARSLRRPLFFICTTLVHFFLPNQGGSIPPLLDEIFAEIFLCGKLKSCLKGQLLKTAFRTKVS